MKRIIHHIRNIRQQPEEVRRHVLHALTLIFAIFLLVLWVYSLGTNFTNDETQDKVEDDLELFSAFKNNFVGGYKSIVNPISGTEE